ncbi:hypothetical protein D3C71_1598650 [compost metagenome]
MRQAGGVTIGPQALRDVAELVFKPDSGGGAQVAREFQHLRVDAVHLLGQVVEGLALLESPLDGRLTGLAREPFLLLDQVVDLALGRLTIALFSGRGLVLLERDDLLVIQRDLRRHRCRLGDALTLEVGLRGDQAFAVVEVEHAIARAQDVFLLLGRALECLQVVVEDLLRWVVTAPASLRLCAVEC